MMTNLNNPEEFHRALSEGAWLLRQNRPQDREQRREGQLEEMRERVGDADEADDAHVATERLRGCGFQGRGRRARRAGL